MTDLVEFLRARLDEDAEVANATRKFEQRVPHTEQWFASHSNAITSMAPHRAVAEVEAKRRLLGSHYDYRGVCTRCFDWQNKPVEREPFPCEVVRLLALPYADHPDYDESWRP